MFKIMMLLVLCLVFFLVRGEAECVRHNMNKLLEFKKSSHEYYIWGLNPSFQLVLGYESACNVKDGTCEKIICNYLKNISQCVSYIALVPQTRPITCKNYPLTTDSYIITYGFNTTNKLSPMTSLTSCYNMRSCLNIACNILLDNDIIGVLFTGQCSL